jgi:hypothetical protein
MILCALGWMAGVAFAGLFVVGFIRQCLKYPMGKYD